jgi:hypothetical protein
VRDGALDTATSALISDDAADVDVDADADTTEPTSGAASGGDAGKKNTDKKKKKKGGNKKKNTSQTSTSSGVTIRPLWTQHHGEKVNIVAGYKGCEAATTTLFVGDVSQYLTMYTVPG